MTWPSMALQELIFYGSLAYTGLAEFFIGGFS
jgi:hypothetical protein